MANTYTQIHIQTVFAVKYREGLIRKEWKDELYKYITGIIQNYDHKVIQINGVEDHIHILFGLRPKQSLSSLMQVVKEDSSKWIKKRGFVKGQFSWQAGYGAFSYSKSEVSRVAGYIQNQEEHHRKQTFREEYLELLRSFDIDFDERFIFQNLI